MGGVVKALAVMPVVSGLHGFVHRGPITPVCRVDEPCDAPAQVTLLFRRNGTTRRVRSDAEGRYRIILPAGIYVVSTVERIGISPNIRPYRVHVRAGHVDTLDFSIDTGIR